MNRKTCKVKGLIILGTGLLFFVELGMKVLSAASYTNKVQEGVNLSQALFLYLFMFQTHKPWRVTRLQHNN